MTFSITTTFWEIEIKLYQVSVNLPNLTGAPADKYEQSNSVTEDDKWDLKINLERNKP